jgi:hypothetical protein
MANPVLLLLTALLCGLLVGRLAGLILVQQTPTLKHDVLLTTQSEKALPAQLTAQHAENPATNNHHSYLATCLLLSRHIAGA